MKERESMWINPSEPWSVYVFPAALEKIQKELGKREPDEKVLRTCLIHIEPTARAAIQGRPGHWWKFLCEVIGAQAAHDAGMKWVGENLPCRERVPDYLPPSVTPKLRYSILQRDGFRCQLCGCTALDGATLHVDHKQSKANGGNSSPDNLWVLCSDCNLGKGKRNFEEGKR